MIPLGVKAWLAGVVMLIMGGTAVAQNGPKIEADGGRGIIPKGRIQVFVSILPQEYFVERVGGHRVEVQALVKPGSSPATYEPSPRQMAALATAAVFFRIGVSFEETFLAKLDPTMSGLRIVDTRKDIQLLAMKVQPSGEVDKGTHAHQVGGMDPHIWLDPRRVKVQARTMAETLSEIDPAGRADYKRNLENFMRDLDAMDAHLTKTLAPLKGRTFLVFHPAWGYFADAYGLHQEPIEIEGKEPSAKHLARMIDKAKAEGVRVIFVQPQFSQAAVKTVARSIHGLVVPIDPLARDYLVSLSKVAKTVGDTLAGQR